MAAVIRHATPEDKDQVLALVDQFLATTPYGDIVGGERAGAAELYRMALDIGAVFVAEVDAFDNETLRTKKTLVGVIGLVALVHPISKAPMASELAWFVDPAYRKGRVGYLLYSAAEDWARQMGLPVLQMMAPAGSNVGYFYERIGFTPVETTWQKQLGGTPS